MPPVQATEMLVTIIGEPRAREETAALADIARLCGYLPLALRIAGARLASRPTWQVSWFADRLGVESHRLDLLRAGDLEVRASFALSYGGRDQQEQHAFRLLGLLSGDFPAWNLAALLDADADQAEQLLEQLVDAELVEVAGVDITGQVRYRLHDLLADFAAERLADIEPQARQRGSVHRLAAQYITAAHRACTVLRQAAQDGTPASQAAPLALAERIADQDPRGWFNAERSRLITIVEQTSAFGLWDQTWRLAEMLPVMFDWRADWRAWEHTHQLALEAARHIADERAEAAILTTLGTLYRELGRYDRALIDLRRAADIFDGSDDKPHWAVAMRHIGDTFRYQSRLSEAIEAFAAALAIFRDEDDAHSVAGALSGMADASRGLCRWADAERYFRSCLVILDNVKEPLERARAQVRYAMVFRDRHLTDRAYLLLNEALEVFRSLTDRRWEARTLRQLAIVNRNDGKYEVALTLLSLSLSLYGDLADQRGTAVTLRNRGDAYRLAGEYANAASDLQRALGIFDRIGDCRWIARTQLSMAGLSRRQQKWDDALRYVSAALAAFRDLDDRPAEGWALRELGVVLRELDNHAGAYQALAESAEIFRGLGDQLWHARALASMAPLDLKHGEDSSPRLKQASAICMAAGISDAGRIAWILSEW
jgi:tetratricopeptide (TPR) repeat protein